MSMVSIEVKCHICRFTNVEFTTPVPGFTGDALRSIWCKACNTPLVVRYRIIDGVAQVTERLEASKVNVQKAPETGITIRPRASKKH